MANLVVNSASLLCPFGTAPSTLIVTSQMKILSDGQPNATIMDMQPVTNIPPFAMCTSMANPNVQAATAAALGTPTPAPCTFVPQGTWQATAGSILIDNKPCLCNDSTITCSLGGGVVSIAQPGQGKAIT